MKVLLIGNHPLDQQQSMLRFCLMMERELTALGCEVRIIRSQPWFHNLSPRRSGFGKWLGYLDKYLVFPLRWREALKWADIIHICDHSNAVYVPFLGNKPKVVTCHDMLAIRGAIGEDTDCPASFTGKILQRRILAGLKRADRMGCISSATKSDVERLIDEPGSKRVQLILLGTDRDFEPLSQSDAQVTLASAIREDLSEPYILHVGSNCKRKNRDGILRIFARLKDQWQGKMVFAGEPLSPELLHEADELGVRQRVVDMGCVDDNVLRALYTHAFALLFPSRFEGFGWPLIEAQASGCPVVCSAQAPLDEVVESSALTTAVQDEAGFAENLLKLTDPAQRNHYVQLGLKNIARFDARKMAQQYLDLYREVLQER